MLQIKAKPPLGTGQPVDDSVKSVPSGLSKEAVESLEKDTKEAVEQFKKNTSTLQQRLRYLNDVYEGVVQEVDYPFENASNIDMKLGIGTGRTLRAMMSRALFIDPKRVFVANVKSETARSVSNQVEDAFNWNASHESNLVETLKDSLGPIYRDGTAFVTGFWRKRIEKVQDWKTYAAAEEFQSDYPTPEDAGLPEEKYQEILRRFMEPDGELSYVDVNFEREAVVENRAEFALIELAKFFWYPNSARRIEDCDFVGYRSDESSVDIRIKQKTGEYLKEASDDVISGQKQRSADVWETARDYIEGISGRSEEKGRFENYTLMIRKDLDDDGIPEKYLGVFNSDKNKFLKLQKYPIRNNIKFIVPLRFCKRANRLLGSSLLYDGADIFQEISDIHRHRNNVRLITDSPSFVVDEHLKDKVDFGSDQFRWRPGLSFYVSKNQMDGIRQLQISNFSNNSNSLDEENLLIRYVEFVIGPTQGLSGQESQQDPRAPATKHLAKIRQAGIRIDDYLEEFKSSFSDIGELAMALYYQYANHQVQYKTQDGGIESIDRTLFGLEGMTWEINATSISMSPEFEMEKIMALRQEAAQNPLVLQMKPQILAMLWDRFVAASRIQSAEELQLGNAQMPMLPGQPSGAGPISAASAPPNNGIGSSVSPLKSLVGALGLNKQIGGGA